jgi:hypothetical protein
VKVFPHLEVRVRVGCGKPHSKDSLSLLMVQYLKVTCVKKMKCDLFLRTEVSEEGLGHLGGN